MVCKIRDIKSGAKKKLKSMLKYGESCKKTAYIRFDIIGLMFTVIM